MSIDISGPAFPSEQGHIPDGTWNQTYEPGLSLRDYFAARAMAELIGLCFSAGNCQDVAEKAYAYAEAMLDARTL